MVPPQFRTLELCRLALDYEPGAINEVPPELRGAAMPLDGWAAFKAARGWRGKGIIAANGVLDFAQSVHQAI